MREGVRETNRAEFETDEKMKKERSKKNDDNENSYKNNTVNSACSTVIFGSMG